MAYKINDFTSPELAQVIALRMGLGWEGYGIYCALIALLERQPDAALDCNYLMLSFHLATEETTVKAVVENFNLFEFETVDGGRRFFLAPLRAEAERQALIRMRRREAANKRWEKRKQKMEQSARVVSSQDDISLRKTKADNRKSSEPPQQSESFGYPTSSQLPRQTESSSYAEFPAASLKPETTHHPNNSDYPYQSASYGSLQAAGNSSKVYGGSIDLLRNPGAIGNDMEWLKSVAADYKCSMDVLLKLFRLFLRHLSDSKQEAYNTLRDAQLHFYRWLSKPFAKERRQLLIRDEEREQKRRERDEHDAKAITYNEYMRRKGLRSQQETAKEGVA